jgi:hypothetical protein
MKRKYLHIILVLLFLVVLVGCAAPIQAPETQAAVTRVIDGDTI